MHSRVHSSTVYNGQDMETTYMSTHRGKDKEDVVGGVTKELKSR